MKLEIVAICLVIVLVRNISARDGDDDEDEDMYTSTDPKKREPTPCEICRFFADEFESRLAETASSKEIIRTGHGLEPRKKEFKYATSELRLTEAFSDPHICENILEYNVHAERAGSRRYAKGMSETFQTLHGLVDKGVKVELGIPYDLWDKPSAEVTKMHRKCFSMAEYHEDDIEEWYYNHQDVSLLVYLCKDRYLPRVGWEDDSCLEESWTGTSEEKVDFEKKAKDDEVRRNKKTEEKRIKDEERRKKKKMAEKKKRLEKKKMAMKGDTGTPGTKERHEEPPAATDEQKMEQMPGKTEL